LLGERSVLGPHLTICAVGDIGLSGRAANTTQADGAALLFAEVSKALASADITFGNLELPLAGALYPGEMFAAPASGAETLRNAGFNLIHLWLTTSW
jgi:Bacterial capsule synthesis protein PGA_cap